MTSRMLDRLGLLTAEGREAQVRFERVFDAPPEHVWSALTEPDRIERWLGRLGGELRVGGTYRLDVADADSPDAASDRATGEVLACEPPTRLLVSWHFPGDAPGEIEARVEARGAGAVLLLVHRGLDRAGARAYGAGWHSFLDRLDLVLAGRGAEWSDRFTELLPTYRGLLPALGPVRVDAGSGAIPAADPAAAADFLAQWLGWTWDAAGPDGEDRTLRTAPGLGAPPLTLVRAGAVVPSAADAPVTLLWADVEVLRESLTSAVGSGGSLAAGEPGDVDDAGTVVTGPGGLRLRARAVPGSAA